MKPLVSIVIPTYNRKKYLEKSVNSVYSQTYENLEIIILNNNSSDGTEEYLNSLSDKRVKVISREKNIGGIENIRSSTDYASGKYLIVLSDDDLIYPNLVEIAVNDLESNLDSVFWFSSTEIIDENDQSIGYLICQTVKQTPFEHMFQWLSGKNMVSFCSTMYRLEELKRIDGFSNTAVLDAVSRIKLLKRGNALSREEILAAYRKHRYSDTESINIENWFTLIDSLVILVNESLPEYKNTLKSPSRKYFIRTLLGMVPLGNWIAFLKALNMLRSRYGLMAFANFKPYIAFVEFIAPKTINFLRRRKRVLVK
jgi:glycosyltransferase involved in cell wall biosynthesis